MKQLGNISDTNSDKRLKSRASHSPQQSVNSDPSKEDQRNTLKVALANANSQRRMSMSCASMNGDVGNKARTKFIEHSNNQEILQIETC